MAVFFIPVHPLLAWVLAAICTTFECSHRKQYPSHHTQNLSLDHMVLTKAQSAFEPFNARLLSEADKANKRLIAMLEFDKTLCLLNFKVCSRCFQCCCFFFLPISCDIFTKYFVWLDLLIFCFAFLWLLIFSQ